MCPVSSGQVHDAPAAAVVAQLTGADWTVPVDDMRGRDRVLQGVATRGYGDVLVVP